ncbi:MAG TPA: hypothetical protein VFQ57_09985 [Sphingomonas sp.]|jgi:hypothetical protein|nr:hypothetical protein [Sphingomonas sp.]
MKRHVLTAITLASLAGATAHAQTTTYWPAPLRADQAMRMTEMPQGTPVMLRTRTQVSTKTNKPGDRVYLQVAETLFYRGQAVIPAGAVAIGEVGSAQRNGHLGKKGKLEIRLLSVETPSGPVRLTGRAYDEGTSGTAASVATMVFVSALGFFIHGTSATLPADTAVQAYLGEPLRFMQVRGGGEQAGVPTDAAPLAAGVAPDRFDPRVFARGTQSASR